MSTISIRELDPKDRNKAISFAISGMHFDQYIKNPLLLRLYGRYFWYLENSRATHLKAAYQGDELLGVILAEVKGQPPLRQCWYEKAFSRTIDWLQKTFFQIQCRHLRHSQQGHARCLQRALSARRRPSHSGAFCRVGGSAPSGPSL